MDWTAGRNGAAGLRVMIANRGISSPPLIPLVSAVKLPLHLLSQSAAALKCSHAASDIFYPFPFKHDGKPQSVLRPVVSQIRFLVRLKCPNRRLLARLKG